MQLSEERVISTHGSRPVPVIVVGLGGIGSSATAECLARDDFEIVGAVDPVRAGERIGDVEVEASLASIPEDGDVALLCTVSTLSGVEADLETLVASGRDVVSTCEELTLPWLTDPEIAERLDERARAAGKTILGCGVNPGLVMDVLPLMIGTASLRPRGVTVRRHVDLEGRRPQLRKKLGVGHAVSDWHGIQRQDGASFGHSALVESAHLIALGLGWTVDSTTFSRQPLVTDGVVTGVEEVVRLGAPSKRQIELQLVFQVGGIDVDEIEIDGDPPLEFVARGGVHGDRATVARLLAGARVVGGMPAGLRLPIEAPLWFRNPSLES